MSRRPDPVYGGAGYQRFVAVPLFGIEEKGFWGYLKSYLEPTFIMLPFNVISEITRNSGFGPLIRKYDERP